MPLHEQLQQRLTEVYTAELDRIPKVIEAWWANQSGKVMAKPKDFASNDYLGLRLDARLVQTLKQASEGFGFGAGASACLTGYSSAHADVEQAFAEWLGVSKALIFSSGYLANIGIFTALCQRSHHILSDKFCHASLLQGIALSRANHQRYRGLDSQHCRHMANQHPPDLIVSESLFSMEGRFASLQALAQIAKEHQAGLIIDEAHSIGLYGPEGKGWSASEGLTPADYALLSLPLGKAFNGMGGIIAGSSPWIDAILQFSPTYRYTTALPPLICKGLLASLALIKAGEWRREKLHDNIQYFRYLAEEAEINLIGDPDSPIQLIGFPTVSALKEAELKLANSGFLVGAIRPPTLPRGQNRLRISLSAGQERFEIQALVQVLKRIKASYTQTISKCQF